MLISQTVDLFSCKVTRDNCCEPQTRRNITLTLDCLAAITLLVLGILAITGAVPIHSAAGWALFGAGLVYSAAMLLSLAHKTRISCSSQ